MAAKYSAVTRRANQIAGILYFGGKILVSSTSGAIFCAAFICGDGRTSNSNSGSRCEWRYNSSLLYGIMWRHKQALDEAEIMELLHMKEDLQAHSEEITKLRKYISYKKICMPPI